MFKNILFVILCISSSLFAEVKVLSFAGSARNDSHNKKLAIEAASIANQMGANATFIDMKDFPMPIYCEDLEEAEGMPETVKEFRRLMIASDAIIIASPNYNGSFTGLLKNALDWASRSENQTSSREAFKGKKFLILSTAPGKNGGVSGLAHLREVITNIGGVVVEGDFGVPNASISFNSEGKLNVPELKNELSLKVKRLLD